MARGRRLGHNNCGDPDDDDVYTEHDSGGTRIRYRRGGGDLYVCLVATAACAATVANAFSYSPWRTYLPSRRSVASRLLPSHHPSIRQEKGAIPRGGEVLDDTFTKLSRMMPACSVRRGCSTPAAAATTRLFSSPSEEDGQTAPPAAARLDENEWRAVVAALEMYRAAYGDLKVPSRFVVPAMPPWPEPAWGLKLGQRVASIRSTGKYVQKAEERRKELDDMGFLWRLRAPSTDKKMEGITFDQVLEALRTYREQVQPEGKINVPSNFVVPNADPWPESTRGLPLGKKIPTIRSKAYLKANPGAADQLAHLGFQFDGKVAANDQRYMKVYNALARYGELNGDLLVPQPFVVPDGSADWPEETWGLRLGARVNAIRSQGTFVKTNPDRRAQLDALGFEWELPAEGKKRGRKKKVENEALMGPAPPGILEGGLQGRNEGGDLSGGTAEDVSAAGTVEAGGAGPESPFDSTGPPPFGDSFFPPLGEEQKERPQAPMWGFEDDDDDDANAAQQVMDEFRPPKDLATSLQEAMEVAKSVGVIRGMDEENRILKGKIDRYCPWYIDDFGDDFVFEDVVEALTVYKSMHGNFDGLDDEDFVVPEATDALFAPAESTFDAEASAMAAAAIAAVEGGGEEGNSDDMIAAEIERIEMEMQSPVATTEAEAETEMEEPAAPSVQWPEHLAGMRLGNIVKRIRDGSLEVKHLRERKRKLDAIGFDWGDPKKFLDVPFEKAMCAMLAYFYVRGDMMVYEDFIIPDEVPWPKALAGYELGKTVLRIRELQNFFEAYHADKVALLAMVDFYWFPYVALPLDPFSWGETPEDEIYAAVGVPFYWLGDKENYPPGLNERIIADGPTDNPDPTVKWYNYEHVRDYWEGPDTEAVEFFENIFGRHLPAEVLWQVGLPKLAREQEARFASGKLGEIVSERFEIETEEDNLLRPILKSMADIQTLKEEHDELKAQLERGEIDDAKFEKEKVPIEWKVEDIISRLKGVTKDFDGGAREEGARIKKKRDAFSVKEKAYEKEVEDNVENIDKVMSERFPDYDPEIASEMNMKWEKAQAAAAEAEAEAQDDAIEAEVSVDDDDIGVDMDDDDEEQ